MLAMAACKKESAQEQMSKEADRIVYSSLQANKLNDSTVALTNMDSKPITIAATYGVDETDKYYEEKGRDTLAAHETVNYTWSLDEGRTIKKITTLFIFNGQYSNVSYDYSEYVKEF